MSHAPCAIFDAAPFRENPFPSPGKANIIRVSEQGTARAGMSDNGKRGGEEGPGTGVIVKAKPKTKKPAMYKVLMLNDDYTPMEFVVEVLKAVFHKPHADATRIMLHVHQNGMGVAGVYPYEVAETKTHTVEELARQAEYPLKCVMEKE